MRIFGANGNHSSDSRAVFFLNLRVYHGQSFDICLTSKG